MEQKSTFQRLTRQSVPLTPKDLAWVAGLLEGEGSFIMTPGHSPTATIQMNDLDIIHRMASMWDGPVYGPYHYVKNHGIYRTSIHGKRAVGWMLTLYAFLGVRRRGQIAAVVNRWKQSKRNPALRTGSTRLNWV